MKQLKWRPDDDYMNPMEDTQYWSEDDWEKYFQEQDKRVGVLSRKTKDKLSGYKEQYIGVQPFICSDKEDLMTVVDSHWLSCQELDDNPACFDLEPLFEFKSSGENPDASQFTLETLPVYQYALSLSDDFSKFILYHMQKGKESPEVHLINTHFFQIQSDIASGHLLGFGREGLAGNIARLKRSLRSIHRCINALVSMRRKEMDHEDRLEILSQKLITLRDDVIKYIYDLRNYAWWD